MNCQKLLQPATAATVAIGEDEIDLNLMGTFPASDPPSWTLGVAQREEYSRSRKQPLGPGSKKENG